MGTRVGAGQEDPRFGADVPLLPDPGGDGVSDLVVAAPPEAPAQGPRGRAVATREGSVVYVFDGTLSGSVAAADADVTMNLGGNAYWAGETLKRAGDLDLDGTEDMIVEESEGGEWLWYGPFSDESTVAEILGTYGHPVAAVAVEGGAPDLAMVRDAHWGCDDPLIYLFHGPLPLGTYGEEEADRVIAFQGLDQIGCDVEIAFVDSDGDGEIEVPVGDPRYRGSADGADPYVGMIAFFDAVF